MQMPGPTISLAYSSAKTSSCSLLVATLAATMFGLKPMMPKAISLSPSFRIAGLAAILVGPGKVAEEEVPRVLHHVVGRVALDFHRGWAGPVVDLHRRPGVDAEPAERHHVPADDPPQGGTGAVGAEPFAQCRQRTGLDHLALGRHPLERQLVPLADAAGAAHMTDAFVRGERHGRGDPAGAVDVAGEAALHELRLELRVDHVRLDDRIHVLFVDLDDAVHAPHVELDAAGAAGVAIDAPTGARRFELHAGLVAEADDSRHLFGAARHDYGFESRFEVLRHGRLAGSPRPGIQVHRVVRDVLRPDYGLEGLILLFRSVPCLDAP